jgi:predicted ABC-type ATPase
MSVFYLLAGPNGAGKSSLYKAACADGLIPAAAEFVNAALNEAAHLQHIEDPQARSQLARQWADARRDQFTQQAAKLPKWAKQVLGLPQRAVKKAKH